jgi:two-component system, OmpR family, sensor histidine kinase BaeS
MNSLRVKLILGFAVASLIGIGLVALLTQSLTFQAFREYLDEASLAGFAKDSTRYYQQNGTFEGINNTLPPPPPPLVSEAAENPTPQPAGRRNGILDNNNRLVSDFTSYHVGEVIDPSPYTQIPIVVDGQKVGLAVRAPALRLSPPEQAFVLTTSRTLLGAGALGLLVAVLLGFWLSGRLTKPLVRLTHASGGVGLGKPALNLPITSSDEIGQLTSAFNQMSADLEMADRQRRQLTADIAHDLGTPLTVVSGYVQAMKDNKLPVTQERLETVFEELGLLQSLIEDLRLLSLAESKQLTLEKEETTAKHLLEQVQQAFAGRAEQAGLRLTLHLESNPTLLVDSERLRRVLGNLVSNAIRHTPYGGEIRLIAKLEQGQPVLQVADTGQGIPQEKLPHIFDRFYRADEHRNHEKGGSGLGLAIVKALIELHGGAVSAQSVLEKGTTFQIALP